MTMSVFMMLLVVAACGSQKPTPVTTVAEPTATAVLPDAPFDQLDHDQRHLFMEQKVVPAMAPIFKQHDPKAFAELGCKTCHGKRVDDHDFEMPNPDLPKLNFADPSKFDKTDLEWMQNVVKPTMAKLLSRPELSPENPKGFGCHNCHTTE